ncbi:MAG: YciI family protein [Imperialibacter sp.]
MRRYLIMMLFSAAVFSAAAQNVQTDADGFEFFEMQEGDTTYIMKKYFFVMLNSGPTRSQTKEEAAAIQEKHLAHINWMASNGYVNLAGPVESEDEFRGILVFNVTSLEEVEKLVAMDPAVKAGRLVMKIYPWWCVKGGVLR